jgi:RND superfamily putative drug exporter
MDATLIRVAAAPAAMTMLGHGNPYLPSWLSWMPKLHVEGDPEPAPHGSENRPPARPRPSR